MLPNGAPRKAMLSACDDSSVSLVAAFPFLHPDGPSESLMLKGSIHEGCLDSPQCERVAQIEFPVSVGDENIQ